MYFHCPGGYDRGECLNTVESFDLLANTWTEMPAMRCPRGRFDVTQIQGKLFACGGSNGHRELRTVEAYDTIQKTWEEIPAMTSPRSSAGMRTKIITRE